MTEHNFTAYYDVSGAIDDASNPLAFAALLSTPREWKLFDAGWRHVLHEFDVPYLHMREFIGSRGPYKGWNRDAARRRLFLSKLISLMQPIAITRSLVLGIRQDVYDTLNSEYVLGNSYWEGAYMFGFIWSTRLMETWAQRRTGMDRDVLHVPALGDGGQGDLRKILNRHPELIRKVSPASTYDRGTGVGVPGLQACDLIAYEWAKERRRALTGNPAVPRRSYLALKETLNPTAKMPSEQNLRDVIARHPNAYEQR